MDLKNITVEDLKAKLQGVDKKTYIKFGIGFGAVFIFLIIYLKMLFQFRLMLGLLVNI